MMYNIKTGYGGITQRSNSEIVILVSSLRKLVENGVKFIFSDRHAYLAAALFSSQLDDLDRLDWEILRRRDFQRDPEDPEKVERYQAEALVHQSIQLSHLFGIVTVNDVARASVMRMAADAGKTVDVQTKANWYFT